MDEFISNEIVDISQPDSILKKERFCGSLDRKFYNGIAYSVLLFAVVVLYILHFTTPKPDVFRSTHIATEPGSGEIVYVNLDIINENYKLVSILTGDIKVEMSEQEVIFANKEKAFQKRYTQFQENVNAGVLTQVQTENAYEQLMQEYQQLEADKERVFNNLQVRQSEALLQIYDSLQAAVKRVNVVRNASFVVTYQMQSPFLLVADPTKDITDIVLSDLNRFYKK